MLREKTRATGICSMVLGIILTTYGGYRIGRRIDWAVNYVYGVYSTPYRYVLGETQQPKIQLSREDQEEIRYVLNSIYVGAAGIAAFLAGGVGTIVTRERIGAPRKSTKYRNLRPHKGTPQNPYRL